MTKVKLGFNLLILCLIAGAGLAVFRAIGEDPKVKVDTSGKELITFTVIFRPEKPDRPVNISWVAGSYSERKEQERSPFVREYMLPPGSTVELLAVQFGDGLLTCKIRKGLKNIATDEAVGPGGVECRGTT